MNATKIILPGLIGTSLMTLFSYAVSVAKKRNFREPVLLAEFEKDPLQTSTIRAEPAGWATHYTIGIAWVMAFHLLWQRTNIKPTPASGLALGLISGVTGVLCWSVMFKTDENPPKIPYKRFYGHLILAHIVYSLSATMTAKIIAGEEYKDSL